MAQQPLNNLDTFGTQRSKINSNDADNAATAASAASAAANAQATANAAIPLTQKGAASGVSTLGVDIKVPLAQMTGKLATTDLTDGAALNTTVAGHTTALANKISVGIAFNASTGVATIPSGGGTFTPVSSTAPTSGYFTLVATTAGTLPTAVDGITALALNDSLVWTPALGVWVKNKATLLTADIGDSASVITGPIATNASAISALNTTVSGHTTSIAVNTAAAVQVTANVVISVANNNAATYNGKILEFTGAYSVTIGAGLPNDFGFAGIPPASGNASIVSDGTTQLNGSTTTQTRAYATQAMFTVTQRNTSHNQYVVV